MNTSKWNKIYSFPWHTILPSILCMVFNMALHGQVRKDGHPLQTRMPTDTAQMSLSDNITHAEEEETGQKPNELLKEALERYEGGQVDEVIELLWDNKINRVLILRSNKKYIVLFYRLLINCYYALKPRYPTNPFSSQHLTDLLNTNPNYRYHDRKLLDRPSYNFEEPIDDPRIFDEMQSFNRWIVSFAPAVAANISMVDTLDVTSLGSFSADSSTYTSLPGITLAFLTEVHLPRVKIDSGKAFLGMAFGLEPRLERIHLRQKSRPFEYSSVLYDEFTTRYGLAGSLRLGLEIPSIVRAGAASGDWLVYIRGGYAFSLLWGAQAAVTRSYVDGSKPNITEAGIPVGSMRVRQFGDIFGGVGFGVRFDRLGIGVEGRYVKGLTQWNRPDERFRNAALLYQYLHTDHDFKVNQFTAALMISYNIFKIYKRG